MHVQIELDRTGDIRHEFDPADDAAVAAAVARFRELTGKGCFRATSRGPNGVAGKIVGEFDPTIEQVLFIPQLQGE
jgi:hypothetical protein